MARIIDGTRLFMNEDSRLTLEFYETILQLKEDKMASMDDIADRFKSSESDGERDALAILMKAELMTLNILEEFEKKASDDLEEIGK